MLSGQANDRKWIDHEYILQKLSGAAADLRSARSSDRDAGQAMMFSIPQQKLPSSTLQSPLVFIHKPEVLIVSVYGKAPVP